MSSGEGGTTPGSRDAARRPRAVGGDVEHSDLDDAVEPERAYGLGGVAVALEVGGVVDADARRIGSTSRSVTSSRLGTQ